VVVVESVVVELVDVESVVVEFVVVPVLVALEVDDVPRPRATDETHWPWLLTDGLCGLVAVQLLRATDETVEPWFPFPFPLPFPPFACVGERPPTNAKAAAMMSATATDSPSWASVRGCFNTDRNLLPHEFSRLSVPTQRGGNRGQPGGLAR
jgi:hypothetical protein